jgi:DNA polymerase-3 subunit epsilon
VPVDSVKFVAIDTELTGLDNKRDRIISIGAVKMQGKRILAGDTFYEVVKPNTRLSGESVVIHGITPSELEEKPSIEHVLPNFMDYCGYHILVGFCPQIDVEFINKELEAQGDESVVNMVVDILAVYNWLSLRSPARYKSNPKNLYEIASGFEIPVKGAHNALADAYITAQVFQRMLHDLAGLGISYVDELCHISNPSKVGDALRLSTKTSNM